MKKILTHQVSVGLQKKVLNKSINIYLMKYMILQVKLEKKILFLRYYEGKTQTEISEEVGISQAQVSRLEKGAICELRKYVSVQVS